MVHSCRCPSVQKVGDIIKSDPDRRFVVPFSAYKRFKDDIKVIDLLYKAYNAESEQEFECTFDTIKDRYQSIIDELNLTVDLTEEFEVIKKKTSKIKSVKNMQQVVGNI